MTEVPQKRKHSVCRKKKWSRPSSPAGGDDHPHRRQDPSNSTSHVVFNVMSFGAVGDGVEDDIAAVNKAWDAACQSQSSAMLLLPSQRFLYRTKYYFFRAL